MLPADFDVAVLGAGASGLYAAAQLCRRGCSVLLLEARERVGGRIHTRQVPDLAYPVELGAEFVHGDAPLTLRLLREAGSVAVDTAGRRVVRRAAGNGRGASVNRAALFEQAQRLLRQAALMPEDLSVEEFLKRHAPSEDVSAYVRMMVEGFDAADPHRASVKSIAAEWTGSSLQGQYRPLGGYGAMTTHLARQLDAAGAQLQLGSTVESVEWGGELVHIGVRYAGGSRSYRARRAIIALPLSALQPPALPARAEAADTPGVVRFEPDLRDKHAALAGLALGSVIKVVLHFRRPFWEELHDGRFADAGFMHAPQAPFPTLWSALPFRAPLLTAWMGGPRVERLAAASRERLVELALSSVQQVLQVDAPPADELVGAYLHDWSADPLARGAYSYLAVGGASAPAGLARPLRDRLYFAGEAASDSHTGTVEAALHSGAQAAAAVWAAMRGAAGGAGGA